MNQMRIYVQSQQIILHHAWPDNEELRGVINSGHTRDLAYTLRCVGDNHEPTRFSTWCAKVIAGIGHLADTILDRSIVIQLRRKLENEICKNIRDIQPNIFNELKQKCLRFSLDNIDKLVDSNANIPKSLNDRAADNWQPLLTIAALAGIDWLTKAKQAALHYSADKQESLSAGAELLQDIKNIFNEKCLIKISTSDLLEALCEDTELPWATYNRGKALSPRQLAKKLREFGISSGTIRFSDITKKGYTLGNFEDAFKRYIPERPKTDSSAVTPSQPALDKAANDYSNASQSSLLRNSPK
jgi:putative DNA primase/helicase